MCVCDDYLLPYLVLDRTKGYMTIPVLIRYFRGSDGRVDLDAIMTCMNMTIVPIVIMYLSYHKYIVKGVAAGAVKG